MTVDLDGQYLKISMYSLLDRLTPEQKREAAAVLVWDSDLFTDVVDDLAGRLATPSFNSNIHEARLRLMDKMPEVAVSLIRGLMSEIETVKAQERQHSEWAWQMSRSWPDEYCHRQPAIPDWVRHQPTKEEAAAVLAEAEKQAT